MSDQKLRVAVHSHCTGHDLPGKHFWLDDDGNLQKRTNGTTVEARLEVKEFDDLTEIRCGWLDAAKKSKAVANGRFEK